MENYFARLNQLDVSKHIEKKGQFSYLSWPYAVAQLRLADPTAAWEVRRFAGLPFQRTDCGFFVEVAVTVQGVTLSQVHPVLDGKNRPIDMPSAFDINTSIQRCLVKAIALHGLGLYIYAGEDLPTGVENMEFVEPRGKVGRQRTEQPASPAAPAIAATLSAEQIAKVKALLAETGTALQRLLAFLRVDSLNNIPAADFQRVIQMLEQAKRRAA